VGRACLPGLHDNGLFGFLSLRRKQGALAWDSPVAGGLLIAAASTLIFGGWSIIFAAGPEKGYLAENVAPIAEMQAQLLNLQEDVTLIKETTGDTATQVAAIATAQAEGSEDICSRWRSRTPDFGSLPVSLPCCGVTWKDIRGLLKRGFYPSSWLTSLYKPNSASRGPSTPTMIQST
jgi:hypothetical protein